MASLAGLHVRLYAKTPGGWCGKILRVNLSKQRFTTERFNLDFALKYLGGRGFATKILWEEVKPLTNPLSSENKLVLATGPLTGLPIPSSGKLVIASKSPLTGGYGDGNIGTWAAVALKLVGFDIVVIEGKAEKPTLLLIKSGGVEFLDAREYWGLGTFKTEELIRRDYGGKCAVLCIGPAGENLVKYANVISSGGRAGGRPGMGAVMGSKKLKAIAIKPGDKEEVGVHNPGELKKLASEAYKEILEKPGYEFWRSQGTMYVVEWGQEFSALPVYNFREAIFEYADKLGGFEMEKYKISQRGCPFCNAHCGNVVLDCEGLKAELDYENVALLGVNLGFNDLRKVAHLSRMADDLGMDTISLGNSIGFYLEAREKKLVDDDTDWGDYHGVKALIEDTAYRRGSGKLIAEGVNYMSNVLKGGSRDWAMHVKGLEISGYDCHAAPAMALAYGTSPIGAHHKDAWIISWEVKSGRLSYSKGKVEKLVELQRWRGGVFEALTVCRLPWVELGFSLNWYPRFLKAATGVSFNLNDLFKIADRIYTLIRAFWVREYGSSWSLNMDVPPARWFKEPLTKGPFKGAKLDLDGYLFMLKTYYEVRGWDYRGIPRKSTLKTLGLSDVARELEKRVKLNP